MSAWHGELGPRGFKFLLLPGRTIKLDEACIFSYGNAVHRCGNCEHVHLHGDPRRGFCVEKQMMVPGDVPILCDGYVAR